MYFAQIIKLTFFIGLYVHSYIFVMLNDDEIHFLTKCDFHLAEINSLFQHFNNVSKHFKDRVTY